MITADLIESVPGERIVLKEPWAALTAELKRRPSGPVAAFTGRRSVDSNGAWAHLEAVLRAADREVIRFSEIEAEPGIETVERMIALLKEIKPAAVIALGGGSVMDAAKAAYLAMQSGWKLADHFGVDCCSRVYPEAAPDRVICIPTTSGTGSEATPYANIVDRRLGVKKLISERFIVPALALSIPAFTHSMPPAVTRATGCDALAHLIEGFLNVGADANSERMGADRYPAGRREPARGDCRRRECRRAEQHEHGGDAGRHGDPFQVDRPAASVQLLMVRQTGTRNRGGDAAARIMELLSRQPEGGGADDAAGGLLPRR